MAERAGHNQIGTHLMRFGLHDDNILIDITSREILDGEIYAIRDGEALYPVIDAPMADLDVVGKVVWRGSML
jgi:hypothetical protein